MRTMMWTVAASLVAATLTAAPAERLTRVDDDGVWRWTDDDSEVALFGVNLYVPFALDHAALRQAGADHDEAIRQSIRELTRLGLTSIRLHCWDREISDPEGALQDNEHLRLLDLLVAECKAAGIYTVLTPIAWWGTPNPTDGFSDRYAMHRMTTDREAWSVQARYLAAFVSHRNRYTGLTYGEDPAVVAFELINEPLYPSGTSDADVTAYINALARGLRSGGTRKPVFYNCWADRHAAAAAAELEGVTFGWYPTGLVNGHQLRDNRLNSVADFPGMRDPVLRSKAKMVYEFDAADVQAPYMYPAMARAFRSGGCQVANQFQYDLTPLAGTNCNWQTHYLNLVYTPGKALSFAIAAEVFRDVPRFARYPGYPVGERFGEFRVSFSESLSEKVSPTDFLYSNSTASRPPEPGRLERIWGVGESPVAGSDGTGAYFLDRIRSGVWSLHVYPDAVMVADPYVGGTAEKVRLLDALVAMRIEVPDLGGDFRCRGVADAGDTRTADGGRIRLNPGAYLLTRPGISPSAEDRASAPAYAGSPVPPAAAPAAFTDFPSYGREGMPLRVEAEVADPEVRAVRFIYTPAGDEPPVEVPGMRRTRYAFVAEFPGEVLREGRGRLFAVATTRTGEVAFPGGISYAERPSAEPARAVLWRAATGMPAPEVSSGGTLRGDGSFEVVPGNGDAETFVRLAGPGFGPAPACVAFRFAATGPETVPEGVSRVVIRARGGADTRAVEIGFVQDDGRAYGVDAYLSPGWNDIEIPIAGLRPLWQTQGGSPDLTRLREISAIFGTWLFPDTGERDHRVDVAEIRLETGGFGDPVVIESSAGPVVLARGESVRRLSGQTDAALLRVAGLTPGRAAVRAAVKAFDPAPSAVSFRLPVEAGVRELLAKRDTRSVVLTMRAGQARTDRVEVVLLEEDGSPWGTSDIVLTPDWQRIRLPLDAFRFFDHWAHPEGRGGEGDRLDPPRIAEVSVCFGAWLYGDESGLPHALEFQDIAFDSEE